MIKDFYIKIKKNIDSRLSAKLGVLLFVFAVIPLLITSVFFVFQLSKIFNNEIIFNRQEIIRGYSRDISSLVNKPLTVLKSFSSLIKPLYSDKSRLNIALLKLSLDCPEFRELYAIDLGGEIIASSFPEHSEDKNTKNDLIFADKNKTKNVVQISNIYFDSENVPMLDISVPFSFLDQQQGVLYARIALNELWDVVDTIRIGKTGKAFVATGEGLFIAHWDKKKVLQGNYASEELIDRTKNINQVSCFLFYDEVSKKKKIFYYEYIQPMGWLFAVVQDVDEAYFFYNLSRIFTIFIVCFVFVAAIGLSVRVARKVTNPIKALSRAVDKFNIENYDIDIRPESEDEVGQLVKTFMLMSERLKKAAADEHLIIFGTAAAHIAHKIKNAIVSIKTYAQLFPKRRNSEEFLDKMQKQLIHDVERVEDMLSRFARLNPKEKQVMHKTAVIPLLQELAKEKEYSCDSKGIKLAFDMPSFSTYVSADAQELYEVMLNIVNNAIDAMPNGGTLCISAFERKNNEGVFEVHISFKDTGIGIAADKIDKIYDFFHTTKPYGMGIGLAYCKRIISRYNGEISITSDINSGTVVTLIFPSFVALLHN